MSSASIGWLLIGLFIEPLVLFEMVAVIMLTFTFIRPFVGNAFSRWVAFLSCVAGLTLALMLLTLSIPQLAK